MVNVRCVRGNPCLSARPPALSTGLWASESRQDPQGYWRSPPAEQAFRTGVEKVAREQPLHEGTFCLDRIPEGRSSVHERSPPFRQHEVQLLEALELRARRHYVLHHCAAQACHVLRTPAGDGLVCLWHIYRPEDAGGIEHSIFRKWFVGVMDAGKKISSLSL